VPFEQIRKNKVSKSINNPCTILDGKPYCSMFTYFDLVNVGAHIIQGEEMSNDGGNLFDLSKYRGANIDGAVTLEMKQVRNNCAEFSARNHCKGYMLLFKKENFEKFLFISS